MSHRSFDKSQTSRLAMFNICLLAGIAILVIAETVLTNNQVALGGQSNALQQQKAQLADQVSQLSTEVSRYKSLKYINERATKHLNMEPLQKNLWYLSEPLESKP